MAAYFHETNLGGFANWMEAQAQEENSHAMKFYKFIMERGGRVTLTTIDGPPTEWNSVLDVYEATLEHEQKVTGLINDLMELAVSEKDHATQIFLQWFVTEQVEEEDGVNDIISELKLMGDAKGPLFMLNRELGQRTFTADEAGDED
jgi:ferritin